MTAATMATALQVAGSEYISGTFPKCPTNAVAYTYAATTERFACATTGHSY
jgi:hypothetical protein